MKQHIGHLALVVRDYDEAIKFYTEKLDFELIEDTKLRGCHEITYTSALVLLLFFFVTKHSSNLGYYHILRLKNEQNNFVHFVHFIS